MKPSARGMTLLELMATVAILGVLTSIAVTGYQQMLDNQKRSGAMRSIFTEAQDAQRQARSLRQPVRLAVRNEVRSGRTVTLLRWERLPCEDAWGATCPTPACVTNACGVNGCACSETGLDVELPANLNVTMIDGLCWTGTSAAPVLKDGSKTCLAAAASPTAGQLAIRYDTALQQVMVVEPLTGVPRMVDCTVAGDAGTACLAAGP